MKYGLVFPQYEFNGDPSAIRDYAQMAEELGFNHILAYEHVLGANPERPGGWQGPYTYQNRFYEIFGLFSFMAAVTEKLGFISGILILPQRQTVLVANQAATLDVLSNGRFRMGVGIGWNKVEYLALDQDFHKRGKRMDEQLILLNRLFTEELVQFDGDFDSVPDAGLNPMPVQRPIPIWFGGHHENVLRRIGTFGQGWLPGFKQGKDAIPSLEKIKQYAQAAGRDPAAIGLEPRLAYGEGDGKAWQSTIAGWQSVGATHLSFNTLHAGFNTPQQHFDAIQKFVSEVGLED